MSTNAISLDAIRADAERKYGSTDVALSDGSTVKLLNALRLPKQTRNTIRDLQGKLREDGADQEALLEEVLSLVASSPARAKALMDEIDGDLAVLVAVFERYSEGTSAGEASASES